MTRCTKRVADEISALDMERLSWFMWACGRSGYKPLPLMIDVSIACLNGFDVRFRVLSWRNEC